MTLDRLKQPTTIQWMHRLLQLFLVPFWVIGFLVAMFAIVFLVMWDAGTAGWRDGFDRHGGNR